MAAKKRVNGGSKVANAGFKGARKGAAMGVSRAANAHVPVATVKRHRTAKGI